MKIKNGSGISQFYSISDLTFAEILPEAIIELYPMFCITHIFEMFVDFPRFKKLQITYSMRLHLLNLDGYTHFNALSK